MSRAENYFVVGGLNCAETVLRVLIEQGTIDAPPDVVRMMTGLGGGLHRNAVCGAVLGAVTAISWACGRTEMHQSRDPANRAVRLFLDRFYEEFSELNCNDLRERHIESKDPQEHERRAQCTDFVNRAIDLATEVLKEENCVK